MELERSHIGHADAVGRLIALQGDVYFDACSRLAGAAIGAATNPEGGTRTVDALRREATRILDAAEDGSLEKGRRVI